MSRLTARKRALIASASLIATLSTGVSLAHAQSAQAPVASDDTQTIVVTGIRRGLQDSIQLKKKSTSIIEAVSAEDIGKLPDVSIAESLARLPGLAGQRVNGRAQVISIRGLSPDFSTTLLNGRMQVSSGDNRAAEFDQYPSELVASAVVYKTPDASLVGQGLSGTVNLSTIKPLDFKKRVISVGVRGSYNDAGKLNADSETWGNRFNITYVDQFLDGKLGIALAYAHLDDPTQTKHSKRWWWDKQGGRFGAGHDDALGLHGVEIWANSRSQVRDGYMGIVQYKPNDSFQSVNDIYYSTFDQSDTIRGAMWYQSQWADDITFTNPTFATIGGSEVWTGGRVGGVVPILRNDYNARKDTMISLGSRNTFALGEAWRGVADFGYSKAKRDETVSETYAGYGTDPTPMARTFDTITERVDLSGFPTLDPDLNYADASKVYLGDVAPWGGWGHDGTLRYPKVEDELKTARLSANRELSFGFISGVDVGVDFSQRTKSKTVDEYNLCLKGYTLDSNGNCHGKRVAVGANYLTDATDLSWAGFGGMLSYNVPSVIGAYYDTLPIKDENNYNKFWSVEEKLATTFVRFDINTEVFGKTLRGNMGAQYVGAQQSSSGYLTRPTNPVTFQWFEVSTKYSDFLPNLNLILDVTDKDMIRFGAGKSMARPRMDDLRANVSAGFDKLTGTWSGSGGNPYLKPWRATAYDISYERYLSKGAYLSIAYFYKELKTYIRNETVDFDFTGYPDPSGTATNYRGTMTTPVNGSGGKVDGVEFSGALEGRLLHPWLDGFGLIGSYSRSWTDIRAGLDTDPAKLPGLSGTVSNATLYYEKHGFSARISERYRSPSLGEVRQLFANVGATRILEDRQIDAQLSYEMQDGPLKGMTFLIQANNLTNEAYQTELKVSENRLANGTSFPEVYETYGRTILFGINYKFQ